MNSSSAASNNTDGYFTSTSCINAFHIADTSLLTVYCCLTVSHVLLLASTVILSVLSEATYIRLILRFLSSLLNVLYENSASVICLNNAVLPSTEVAIAIVLHHS